jgi:hypothetical protein
VNGPPWPHGGFTVELFDLAEVNLPMYDEPKHPRLQEYTRRGGAFRYLGGAAAGLTERA